MNPYTEIKTPHVVPVVIARGIGGRCPAKPLYEATIDDVVHVIWELEDERVAYAPAVCPHRPALGPVLHTRGFIDGCDLVCARHGNRYSSATGECVHAEGAGAPGRLTIRFGRRVGDRFALDDSQLAAGQIDHDAVQSYGGDA